MKNNVVYVDFAQRKKVITSEECKTSLFRKLAVGFKRIFSGKSNSRKYLDTVYKANTIL
ncbi:hypothetical protein CSC2_32230 [Clostridium zeae]|uniref:Uncharacterized protein n=1 Tax=Clostridium zeae TaxID=2759022 RepID=A0ABQ1ED53_9CLOT|nr:hypothetical protein [Clostridium zeae]GFZ32697.1 hypothetical protein CSC2_32230 [Clostridium zeae]